VEQQSEACGCQKTSGGFGDCGSGEGEGPSGEFGDVAAGYVGDEQGPISVCGHALEGGEECGAECRLKGE